MGLLLGGHEVGAGHESAGHRVLEARLLDLRHATKNAPETPKPVKVALAPYANRGFMIYDPRGATWEQQSVRDAPTYDESVPALSEIQHTQQEHTKG